MAFPSLVKGNGSLAAHLRTVEATLAEAAFTGEGKYVYPLQLIGPNLEEHFFVRLRQREQALANFGALDGLFERLLFVGLFSSVESSFFSASGLCAENAGFAGQSKARATASEALNLVIRGLLL